MGVATSFTSDRMFAIEQNSIVNGYINNDGHLILITKGGTQIDAGKVNEFHGDLYIEGSGYAGGTTPGKRLITLEEARNADNLTEGVIPNARLPLATIDDRGASEIATQLEVDSRVDNQRYVTPLTLSNAELMRQLVIPETVLTSSGSGYLIQDDGTICLTANSNYLAFPELFEPGWEYEFVGYDSSPQPAGAWYVLRLMTGGSFISTDSWYSLGRYLNYQGNNGTTPYAPKTYAYYAYVHSTAIITPVMTFRLKILGLAQEIRPTVITSNAYAASPAMGTDTIIGRNTSAFRDGIQFINYSNANPFNNTFRVKIFRQRSLDY